MKMKIGTARIALIAAFLAIAGIAIYFSPAHAQVITQPGTINWAPVGGPATLAVTNTTGNVALPSIGPTAFVCNKGSADVFLRFGIDNTVVATASNYWLKANKCQAYAINAFGVLDTYLAAITASSTATLYIETGVGTPQPIQ